MALIAGLEADVAQRSTLTRRSHRPNIRPATANSAGAARAGVACEDIIIAGDAERDCCGDVDSVSTLCPRNARGASPAAAAAATAAERIADPEPRLLPERGNMGGPAAAHACPADAVGCGGLASPKGTSGSSSEPPCELLPLSSATDVSGTTVETREA